MFAFFVCFVFFCLKQAQHSRGSTKFASHDLTGSDLLPVVTQHSHPATSFNTAERSASPGIVEQNQRSANDEYNRRGRSRSRLPPSPALIVDERDDVSSKSKTSPLPPNRNRSRTRGSTSSTIVTAEPITRSRKARVFQERPTIDSKQQTTNDQFTTTRRTITTENTHHIGNRVSSPDGFVRSRSRQRSTVVPSTTSTTITTTTNQPTTHTRQMTASQQRTVAGASRNARRFNINAAKNDFSMESASAAIPIRHQPQRSSRPAQFSRATPRDPPLSDFVNAAIYEENYPEPYKSLVRSKIGASTASRRSDVHSFSLDYIADTGRAFKFDAEPELDIKLDSTTPRNRYTTRQNYKFSMPAYKRSSPTTTSKPPRPSNRGRDGVFRREFVSRSTPAKFNTKSTTVQPPTTKRSPVRYSPRPPILAQYPKKFLNTQTRHEAYNNLVNSASRYTQNE